MLSWFANRNQRWQMGQRGRERQWDTSDKWQYVEPVLFLLYIGGSGYLTEGNVEQDVQIWR